jgi:hypothetical protein
MVSPFSAHTRKILLSVILAAKATPYSIFSSKDKTGKSRHDKQFGGGTCGRLCAASQLGLEGESGSRKRGKEAISGKSEGNKRQ